jgi:hypothetical protein
MSLEVHCELMILVLMSHKLRWKLKEMELIFTGLVIISTFVLCYS